MIHQRVGPKEKIKRGQIKLTEATEVVKRIQVQTVDHTPLAVVTLFLRCRSVLSCERIQ